MKIESLRVSAATSVVRRSARGRAVLAAAFMTTASLACGAGSLRFLQESIGEDPTTILDNEIISTRLAWDLNDSPFEGGGGVAITVATTPQIQPFEILPQANNQFQTITQERVRIGLNNALEAWNDVDSPFLFAGNVIYDTLNPYPDGSLPFTVSLDRVNLLTFQDPLNVLEFTPEDGFTIAATSIFYFNRDVDMANEDLPLNSIGVNFADSFIDLNDPGIRGFLRLQPRVYKAGTIIDSDIFFNQAVPQYDLVPFDPDDVLPEDYDSFLGAADIQAVATHELGHLVGLAHPELRLPTMTAVQDQFTDPWKTRNLHFDDKLSIQMNYHPLFNRLSKAAVAGRLIDGDAVDGVADAGIGFLAGEIQNAPVFIGRVNNDGVITDPELEFFLSDSYLGVDENTSFTNKITMFAQVLTGQEFRMNAFESPFFGEAIIGNVFPDNRFFIPMLPSSSEEVDADDDIQLPAGGYVLMTKYPRIVPPIDPDEVTVSFPPLVAIPQEYYGGARPFFQPGSTAVEDPNTQGDYLVQDNWLQFGYSRLGQFSMRLPGSSYQLVDTNIRPTQNYITYRITSADGATSDVANIDFGTTESVGGPIMIEDDPNNRAYGTWEPLPGVLRATQEIELGKYRAGFEGDQSDMRVTVHAQNISTQTVKLGLRYLVRPALEFTTKVDFRAGERNFTREVTLTGSDIPAQFTWQKDSFPDVRGIATLDNGSLVTRPDKLQFANWTSIFQATQASVAGQTPQPVIYDYVTNNLPIEDAAYAVYFDQRTLLPGQSVTFSTDMGYARERTYVDGPVPGPQDPSVPGEDDPLAYALVDVPTNTVVGGLDILTNTGTPGGLTAGPGDPDDNVTTSIEDLDGDQIENALDNCPDRFNTDQSDFDADGVGDVCDQDTFTFTDVSPVAPVIGDNPQNVMPYQALNTYGAAMGDLDNDGYPDMVLANGAISQDAPQSLINRVYMNVPDENDPTRLGRRFVDMTFGRNAVPADIDDRLPSASGDVFASYDVKMADFDNDGDLDLFFSVFATQGAETFAVQGGQNRFFENIDVDDTSINISPDDDEYGDAFFRDVTALWDPGILNQGAFNEYENTISLFSYPVYVGPEAGPTDPEMWAGAFTDGFDISTRSDVGDLDGDGDIDVVVSNLNTFLDLFRSTGINIRERIPATDAGTPGRIRGGGLRFSERILINHTLDSPFTRFTRPDDVTTRFSDQTLGRDNKFGWSGLTGDEDRMPPLKPEWNRVSTTGADNAVKEVDFSNTNLVKVASLYENGKLDIVAFDRTDRITGTWGTWDGDEILYRNIGEGVFEVTNYGASAIADSSNVGWDGGFMRHEETTETELRVAVPDNLPGDPTTGVNVKNAENSMTMAGLVFDNDLSGWSEVFTFNATGGNTVFADRETNHGQFHRGGNGAIGGSGSAYSSGGWPHQQELTLPRYGRPRTALTDDFNLDGLPDIFLGNDTDQNVNVNIIQVPAGHKVVYMNVPPAFDNWSVFTEAPRVSGALPGGITEAGKSLITNETVQPTTFMVAGDYDLDGDVDVASFNFGPSANFYRNELRKPGVLTVPEKTGTADTNPYDLPMFVDQTYRYLSPYSGSGANLTIPGSLTSANITLGADLADMDGDNDMDLVFANGGIGTTLGERQIMYKNIGPQLNDGLTIFNQPNRPLGPPSLFNALNAATPSPAYDVKFVDLNLDSGPDILFTTNGGPPRVFMNTDSDSPIMTSMPDADTVPDGVYQEDVTRVRFEPPVPAGRYLSRRMAVGDVNNDGYPDIVIANGSVDGAPNVLLMNEEQGGEFGYLTDRSDDRLPIIRRVDNSGLVTGEEGLVLDNTFDVALVDVDDDGDLDIIFANSVSTDGQLRRNVRENCRLLLNNLDEVGAAGFRFVEVATGGSEYAQRLVNGFVEDGGRWPMLNSTIQARGLVVGDFSNKGEQFAGRLYPAAGTEDVNGNGRLDPTEDLNANKFLDFHDVDGDGRHAGNYDVVFVTEDFETSNVMLVNSDVTGDGISDGYYVDESAARFPNTLKFQTYGGDAGDVNQDGLVDLVLAINIQTPLIVTSSTLIGKCPVQLYINTSATNGSGAGIMQDVSGHNAAFADHGELPVFMHDQPEQISPTAGNARQVRLGDIDRDGDLDMIVCEAGRVSGPPPYTGWANSVLVNMANPRNLNSRDVLSVRDPGGPIVFGLTPGAGAVGQRMVVKINGKNFVGSPSVDFGPGISVLGNARVAKDGRSLTVTVQVQPEASLGQRRVKVTNPDGLYVFGSTFQVLPSSFLVETAADKDWMIYE